MDKSFCTCLSVQGMGNWIASLFSSDIFVLLPVRSYKKVPYLQDVKVVEQTVQQGNLYDAKIMSKRPAYYCSFMYQSGIGCPIQSDCCQSRQWGCQK